MRFTFSHQKLIENKIAPFRCSTWENFHVYLRAIRVLINGRHDFSLGKIAHFDRQFWGLFFCVLSKRAERSCVKHGLSFFQNCLPERLKQKINQEKKSHKNVVKSFWTPCTRHSSPILNSKRWTRVINLSSFFYVIVLLLLWGHEPCIGFFFSNSMRLTLLYVIQAL
jgi:hypothetical protein